MTGQGVSRFLEGCSVMEVEVLDMFGRLYREIAGFNSEFGVGVVGLVQLSVRGSGYGGKVSFVAGVAYGKGRVVA